MWTRKASEARTGGLRASVGGPPDSAPPADFRHEPPAFAREPHPDRPAVGARRRRPRAADARRAAPREARRRDRLARRGEGVVAARRAPADRPALGGAARRAGRAAAPRPG